jgi:DNA-3-methyladenine glycosylase
VNREFFDRSVHKVARDLIGCRLAVGETAGIIVETEAYEASDPACHAYIGRTARNEVLFGPPGHAYVYLSYGIHSLLNFVTEPEGTASAVLIRALEPTDGIELMRERRGRNARARDGASRLGLEQLCSGPGKLTEALGVDLSLNGTDLLEPPFELDEPAAEWAEVEVVTGPRIGITKAAELPWRYSVAGSRYVSKPWPAAFTNSA